jgi:hypothetical protein
MATAKDYLLNDDLDLVIANGDFKKGPSDQQASILLLNTNVGAWKYHPFCGMGIKKYMGSSGTELKMKREITVQHEADGMRMNEIYVKDFKFYLNFSRPGYDD